MDDVVTIAEITRGLERWYTQLGRQYGALSRPQRRVMSLLGRGAEVRIGELAERLDMSTAGATRMVDALESMGYVRRFRVPETDQRQVYVALTSAGEQALKDADHVFQDRVRASLEVLTPEERANLARILTAVADRPKRHG